MKDPFGIFNFNDFKKWMNEKNENHSQDNLIGLQVGSKISTKKLLNVCEVVKGDSKKVLKEFYENGGTILNKDKNILTIENKKGKFEIHKMYIKSL